MAQKIRALLATARIANVPSVVSNVWLGILITAWSGPAIVPGKGITAAVSGILLYIAGNFFNDWYDREWDARHRPERALPTGLFRPAFYLRCAGGLMILGWVLACVIGGWLAASLLVALILIYTRFHKQTKWAVIAMGLCRAMLPLLGASSIPGFEYTGGLILAMLALFCYIAGISLSARYETMAVPHAGAMLSARGLLIGAGMANAWVAGFSFLAAPYFVWLALALTLFRKPLSRQVSALLAGIPLLDWIVTLPLAFSSAWWPIDCWAAGRWIAPLAFLSALLLQRLAPAT